MTDPDRGPGAPGPARRSRWIGLLVLLVLGLGIGVSVRQWQGRGAAPGSKVGLDPPERAIEDALRQARGATPESVASLTGKAGDDKSRWVPEVKGFDVSDLTPVRRELFVRLANAQRCTCGCGYTLAGCRTYDPTCPVSGPRVEKLLDSVRAGRIPSAPAPPRKPGRRG